MRKNQENNQTGSQIGNQRSSQRGNQRDGRRDRLQEKSPLPQAGQPLPAASPWTPEPGDRPFASTEEAFAWMHDALAFGIRLGLERMQDLMAELGNPERSLRCIHIAGTNGKGSVSAFSSAILAASGNRVGVFTSPYLERFTERIRIIDGRKGLNALQWDETAGEIPLDAFTHLIGRVRGAVDRLLAAGSEHPTEFELITAVAFLYFAACALDVVVLETGLGGRLDSTNVIERPLSVIITAIGYDHMDRLGSTITEISTEKAGIIKRGCAVYLYDPEAACPNPDDATAIRAVFEQRCRELQAPLTVVRRDQVETLSLTPDGQCFRIHGLKVPLADELRMRLLGYYQPLNAALAITACRGLTGLIARPLRDASIRRGILLTRWPGRLELVRKLPPVIVDGGHNRQGAEALAESLRLLYPTRQLILVCGVMRDKEYEPMLRAVLAFAAPHLKALICVTPDNPRALPAASLAATAESVYRELIQAAIPMYNNKDMGQPLFQVIARPADSVMAALQLADPQTDLVCVFGSLYLAGPMRRHFLTLPGGQPDRPGRTPGSPG